MQLIPGKLYEIKTKTSFNIFNGKINTIRIQRDSNPNFETFYEKEIIMFLGVTYEQNYWHDIHDIWVFYKNFKLLEYPAISFPEYRFVETLI